MEGHAPEFEEPEFPQSLANAELGLENRAAVIEFDGQGDRRKERG